MKSFTSIFSVLATTLALGAFALPARAAFSGTLGNTTSSGSIDGSGAADAGSTGQAQFFGRKRRFPTPDSAGLWEVRLPPQATPSGFNERFLIQVPSNPVQGDVPLLVAFHRFGNSMYDIPINTQLLEEAEARGWYVVAPMGISDDNLNSVASQQNIETVIGLMTRFYPIDEDRIYGIGHSMGGGNALSYGARHLDPEKPMFAALVNNAGVMSQQHSYENDCMSTSCTLQPVWEFWYGGTPATNEFAYCRSSLIEIPFNPVMDTAALPTVDQQTDMARNLTHIPTQTWIGDSDPLQELIVQNIAFDQQMALRGGDHTLRTVVGGGHNWNTMNYTEVFDFLGSKTLTMPTSAKTLVDRNGTFFHFEVTQTSIDAFTPITWSVDSATNSLSVTETANLSTLEVNLRSAGLSAEQGDVIFMDMATSDGFAPEIRLVGAGSAPIAVTRDGQPVTSWSYSDRDDLVLFQETDGLAHQWSFTF